MGLPCRAHVLSVLRKAAKCRIIATEGVTRPILSTVRRVLKGVVKGEQVVLLVRGVVKGEQGQILANEVGLCRQPVQIIRQQMQANARALQPDTPLAADEQTETDEMSQKAGGKSEPHLDPADPPRRRANKQPGHGMYDNDRPPIVGTVGRDSGKVRLRMVEHTDGKTLTAHVEHFTQDGSH